MSDDAQARRRRRPRLDPYSRVPEHVDELPIKTVIDVGAAHGTASLYARFPEPRLLLVDPLQEHEGAMRRVLKSRPGSYEVCALGRGGGEVKIRVARSALTRSSILARMPLTSLPDEDARLDERTVPLRTLDDVVARHAPPGPFGLKLDTEGFELEVLLGAPTTLASCQWIVAEVSIGRRFEGSYEFVDLIVLLDRHGFRLDNIMKVARSGPQARYADVLFVRREDRQRLPDSI